MRISALQFTPHFLETEENLSYIEHQLSTVETELAVLPELCTTGYFFESKEQLMSVAETCEGNTCTLIRTLAGQHNMVIVVGFAERDKDEIYNSAFTAFPDGSFHMYRKTHLFGDEGLFFQEGNTGFLVHEFEGIRYGIMICYDWRFPESVRTLALRGADIICHPSDLVALPRLWKPVMQTRSFENKVYTITANRTGTESRRETSLTFHGCSQITSINGSILAETDEDFSGWISAEIDPHRARDKSFSIKNDIFSDRRPEFYAC